MRPGPGLLAAALLWAAGGLLAFLFPAALIWWAWGGLAFLALALADLLVLSFLVGRVVVTRRVPASLAIGEASRVKIAIALRGGTLPPAHVDVYDLVPPCLRHTGLPLRVRAKDLAAGGIELEYGIVPLARGEWRISGTDILESSWLGFWRRYRSGGGPSSGKTYPDFKNVARMARAELKGVASSVGLKARRRRGQGTDFMDLRDYEPGDPVKAIDWKATSRRRKPIVRRYQEDIDQEVVFLVDTGYRLHRPAGEGLLLDRALDALLLLSWVALKHQDSVALMSFGADERWVPPRKGPGALPAFMNAIYDLESGPGASSPAAALEAALARLRRRSLIVLLSNLQEEDGESLSWIMPLAARRHLVLAVNIREEEFRSSLARGRGSGEKSEGSEALERAAAFRFQRRRAALALRWESMGILNLETDAASLTPDLVNRYLELKRSGAL